MRKSRALRTAFGFLILFVFVSFLLYSARNGPVFDPEPKEPELKETLQPVVETDTETEAPPEESPAPESAPPEAEKSALPQVDINSWELKLVNPDNNIGEYAPELVLIENNQSFDVRAAEPLKEWIAAARAEGHSVYLSSAYRDYNTQKYLYDRKVLQYNEDIAKSIVAVPGTSEHQLGLAVDITDKYYEFKNSSLENTALFKWLNSTCQDYGFILRYPKDKTEITNIMYEPWHFRYVGVEVAKYIKERNLCLEEFLDLYK
ncbi:MAG: D-alanyl-D-alanine carboxypeptidase family protein [Candidatus Scatomorpha sp.]|jgi:D-alanyl-D-alanine carboxypeptidase